MRRDCKPTIVLIRELAKLATITLYYFSANRSVCPSRINEMLREIRFLRESFCGTDEPQDVEALSRFQRGYNHPRTCPFPTLG